MVEIRKYNKNFLTKVIARLDFNNVINFSNFSEDTRKKLEQEYDIKHGKISNIEFDMMLGKKEEKSIPTLEFETKEKTFKITLSSSFIVFQCTKYSTFEPFYSKINYFLSLLPFSIDVVNRLGLRYINQIDLYEPEPVKWENYINNKLIAFIDNWSEKNNLARAISQLFFNDGSCVVNFKYGIFNPIFPNKIIQKQFILDYDCSSNGIEFSNIKDTLDKFNKKITKLFEDSISDGLRSIMGE
ncbi:hypothetical protein MASR1M68_14830 [Elusimicrobiota bacterium]